MTPWDIEQGEGGGSIARASGGKVVGHAFCSLDARVSLQLIMDEPPEALWIKDRVEYYKRAEPVAFRDEQLDLGPALARIRLSHSWTSGPADLAIHLEQPRVGQHAVYIGKVADKHAKRSRSSGEATLSG